MHIVTFNQVTKVYRGGRQALQKINLDIKQGELAFLTGHSGAGKSTLLKLMCGLERATDGRIMFKGHDITRISERELPRLRRKVGIVFQEPHLIADLTVFENVGLPLNILGASPREVEKKTLGMLDNVGLLDKQNCYPEQLSGGERQRVGIARAMINRPELIIADEPTGNLDDALSIKILQLFEAFNRNGVAVIIATHDRTLIQQRPQYRNIVLSNGCLQGGFSAE